MTPEQWRLVNALFDAAVELPPEAQAAHVEANAGGDARA